jgi:putative ABC transport system permease protein
VKRPAARASLLLSGMRWRARSSVAMFAIAVFAAAAGAFGPMYLHGTDQVVLNGTLDSAGVRNSGLTLVAVSGHGYPGPLLKAARSEPRPSGSGRWFGSPIVTQFAAFVTSTPTATTATSTHGGTIQPARTTFTFVPHAGHRLYLGSLTSRTGVCAHLKMVGGRCSLKRGEVVISTRTAQALHLAVGGALDVGFVGSNRAAAMTVAGVYRPGTASTPYWWGQSFFPFGTYSIAGAYEHVDDVFASPVSVRALAPVSKIYPVVEVPFVHRSVLVNAVPGLKQQLAAFEHAALRGGIRVGTKLFSLLGSAGSVESSVTDIVGIIALELALLAIVVLYFVASRTAEEREPDVRLAELRGYRQRSALGVALGEPVVVVLLAVPTGFAAAWLAVVAVGPAVFGGGIGVGPTVVSGVAAVVAGAAGVAAAALGARRGLSAADGAPGTPGTTATRRWSAALDVAVVAAAGAAFFELVSTGASPSDPHPLSALAPGLLAVALGMLVARGLPRLLALTHRRSAFASRVPLALATRVVARRREFAAEVLVLTLAIGLMSFAACAWSIASTNRGLRAAFGVGAPTVLRVSVRQGVTFLSAVRASDPGGRDAMAAVLERSPGGTTLAVDASRMAAVATWPGSLGMSAPDAARRIVPTKEAPQVRIQGTAVQVSVEAHYSVTPAPDLTMDLFNLDTQTPEQVTFGALRDGVHTYRGPLSFLCTGGCRLVDLAVSWSPSVSVAGSGRPAAVSLQVRSLAEKGRSGGWTRVRASLSDVKRWTSPSGGVRLGSAAGALAARLHVASDGTPSTVAPRDVPAALPVIVTPDTASFSSGDGGPLVAGLDGASVSGHTVGVVPALPGVGGDAVLVDLQTAELFLSGPFTYSSSEVWLSKGAPADIVQRLRRHGIVVTGRRTARAAQQALGHDGISLAYLLYLASSIAAGLLVVGATTFALLASARRREDELASLRAVGVDAASLRRALWIEQLLVLGAALLAGVASGLIAAAVALRSMPEFASKGAGPPLDLGIPPVVVAVTAAVLVAVLAGLTAWHARATVRGATAERLGAGG